MSGWDVTDTSSAACGWDIPMTAPESMADLEAQWAKEDIKKSKLREKRAKERDPEYQIEPRDPKTEAALFGKLDPVDLAARMESLSKVSVSVMGTSIPKQLTSFDDANIFWLIRENLKLCHYNAPTPVQRACIPIVAAGRDIMASAQTGSGKTAAFVIPILNVILQGGPCDVAPVIENDRLVTVYPLVLVLEPTRELAVQVNEETKKFGYRSWVRTRCVYGGIPIDHQVEQLKGRGVDLLIATPGRLQDLINRNFISLSKVRCLVLDEADRMLDMGFEPAVRKLMSTDMPRSNQGRQTLLFSATFPEKIEELSKTFLKDPLRVKVGRVGSVASTITQKFISVPGGAKDSALLDILPNCLPGRVLVFTDSKAAADRIESLIKNTLKVNAGAIHGDKDQPSREQALYEFKTGKISVLCATSVAARGLDIDNVSTVMNYDIPKDEDEYVHRIGRTGRAGKLGASTSLYSHARDQITVARLVKKNTVPWDSLKMLPQQQLTTLKNLVNGPESALIQVGGFRRGGGNFY
ncbi:DEAD-box ATP-dependent RNA helicase [Geranomyces michiganensis]|nr:DEAD-box ATP-dependent RNA helicase [Geranomyces michiganensis]